MKKYTTPVFFNETGGTPIDVEDDFYVGLTRSQWHGGTDIFDAYDKDHNGIIDPDEYELWADDMGL